MLPRLSAALSTLALGLAAAGCAPHAPALPGAGLPAFKPADGEFSVMHYNLENFQFEDRDNDGIKNEFKPQDEIDAECGIIADEAPDILCCVEIGDAAAVQRLREELARRNLRYADLEHLVIPGSHANMAVLSKFPIVSRQSISNETYTIETNTVPVQRGFISVDIQVNPDYRLRVMTAHLKSKRFSDLGQTEMRRNEARLLNKNVRRYLKDSPSINLLVVGDMNDTSGSAAIHEIAGKPPVLEDLRPHDVYGDVWTHYFIPMESCERIDYMFVSAGLAPEIVREKCHIVRDPRTYKASDHRPLVTVIRAREMPASASPASPPAAK